jgi:hypothetical protein
LQQSLFNHPFLNCPLLTPGPAAHAGPFAPSPFSRKIEMEQEVPLHEAINGLWREGLKEKRDPMPDAAGQDGPAGPAAPREEPRLGQARELVRDMSPEELNALAELVQQRQAELRLARSRPDLAEE